ncbi:MAG: AMP-binding protein [Candidatus Acidiferrales bacterium]
MGRQSLLDYFQPASRPGKEIAFVWRRGYRTIRWSYTELRNTAIRFSRELEARGIAKGDCVLIWGENSGEWAAAFLGCVFRGVIAVPMDAIADPRFAERVVQQAGVRLVVADGKLPAISAAAAVPTIPLDGLQAAIVTTIGDEYHPAELNRNDPLEIIFTSGTTAEPRGVALTHGNLLANLEPLEKEIGRYRRYERFVHPLRILDLLPLSHVFGQLLGLFLPQILGAASIFLDTLNPSEVIRAIHDERVSVLVTVPRMIESLRAQIERDIGASGVIGKFHRDFQNAEGERFLRRWWRFRAIHRRLGWKFWAVISGGAALPAGDETFWGRLGYAVIQGYGLTETTSLVSLNHPFRLGRGSIGKAMPGMEVKLSPDGEILVRGENVAPGYWKNGGVTPVADAEGWFHTGDIGERDQQGNLYFKGRAKNVIVTPEGLNVYPQDLEAELRKEPEVRDCVVVGADRDGNAEPCAVLLLNDPAADPGAIVQRANARLAAFQRIRQWAVWPDRDFPRTATQKPALVPIRDFAEKNVHGNRAVAPASSPIADLAARISRSVRADANSATPLQLSSIERVELLSALEDRYQVDLSETEFSKVETIGALERLLQAPSSRPPAYRFPYWAQSAPARWIREAAHYLLVLPAMFVLGWPRILGKENLRDLKGPALVVANHVTYFDPAYILAGLPGRLRRRLAVAMEGERLEAMRNPPAGTPLLTSLANRASYWLVVALFNVFPLPRQAGFRRSFGFAGNLTDRGWSVLVFPEGTRTVDGKMAPFRAGIGLLAANLEIPVLPMRIEGLFERKQAGKRWAPSGFLCVRIGAPVTFDKTDPAGEIAHELERRVAALEHQLFPRAE